MWGWPLGSHSRRVKRTRRSGGLAEDSAGGRRLEVGAAEVVVEALQAAVFEEVLALGLVDAGEDIEVDGEPAVVFGEEMGDELTGVVGAGAGEISPGDLRPGATGDEDAAVADGDLAAVEVERGGVGEEPPEPRRADEGGAGFGIVFRESPVEAGDLGIVDEEIEEVSVTFFLAGCEDEPVALSEEDGDARGGIGVGERGALLERFFEVGEGKA